jgi:cell wall-associated NlpC family hydrolase
VVTAATAVLLVAASLSAAATPVGADAIADKRAEAARIAHQLQVLASQIDQLGQAYDAAQEKLQTVNHQIDDATRQVAAADAQLHTARRQLASYAVQAYVDGGESDLPDILLSGKGPDVVSQVEYLKAASGNRTQLIDDVRAAEYAVKTRLGALHDAQASATSLQKKLTHEKDAADAAMSQQQQLQATVTGQLAQLVRQEQARQAAIAEARARAAATPPPAVTGTASPGTGDPKHGGTTTTVGGHGGTPTTTGPDGPPTTVQDPPGQVVPLPIPPGTPPPVLPGAATAIQVAKKYLGTPYQWGGDTPKTGFDCSGLVQYSFGQAGISLPRVADEQAASTWHVSYANAQAGDLVFFDSPDVGHVGIYLGGGMMLDAPHTGAVVRIEPIWWSTFVGFGRVT